MWRGGVPSPQGVRSGEGGCAAVPLPEFFFIFSGVKDAYWCISIDDFSVHKSTACSAFCKLQCDFWTKWKSAVIMVDR